MVCLPIILQTSSPFIFPLAHICLPALDLTIAAFRPFYCVCFFFFLRTQKPFTQKLLSQRCLSCLPSKIIDLSNITYPSSLLCSSPQHILPSITIYILHFYLVFCLSLPSRIYALWGQRFCPFFTTIFQGLEQCLTPFDS